MLRPTFGLAGPPDRPSAPARYSACPMSQRRAAAPVHDQARTGPPRSPRRLGLRLLAACLVGLWAAIAAVIVVAYRPGGPLDLIVVAAAFLPVPVATIAVIWPPLVAPWRPAAAIAWLGVAAALLAAPLILVVIRALAAGGHQTLLPSAEVAYAGVLALGALCLFASLGVVGARRARDVTSRSGILRAAGLAVLLTGATAVAFGGAAVANELALRGVAALPSRYGPIDPGAKAPECDGGVVLGSGASVSVTAEAQVDRRSIGSARLAGVRSGADERWIGSVDARYGDGLIGYARVGDRAWLDIDGAGWALSRPDPFRLRGVDELTVDGPVIASVWAARPRPVAEDLGIDLVYGAQARHCRTAVDGPTALAVFLPLRWLAGGDMLRVTHSLKEWRGSIDWWIFTDGQLGQASVSINGYPGEAWPTSSGVQGSLNALLTALDRTEAHEVEAPSPSSAPSASAPDGTP
jgi:hypothetical protein